MKKEGVNTPNTQGSKGSNPKKSMVLASRPSRNAGKDPIPELTKKNRKVQKAKG